MKKVLVMLAAMAMSCAAMAQVTIQNQPLGSGVPGATENSVATPVTNGMLHAPQYLPGNPTAATIWPRVIEVKCVKALGDKVMCDGYDWLPEMGRGEYIYIKPRIVEPVAPTVVIKEVPVKKKKE